MGILKSYSYQGRGYYIKYSTKRSSPGVTRVDWTLYMTQGEHHWYKMGPTYCYLNGNLVYKLSSFCRQEISGTTKKDSGYFYVKHDKSGNGNFTWKISTAIYSTTQHTRSGTETLSKNYPYTDCKAPSSIKIYDKNGSTSYASTNNYANRTETITLSWSGAKSGSSNPIKGYYVYARKGSTPTTSTYTKRYYVATSSTSKTLQIDLSTFSAQGDDALYFKVLTIGTKSGYSSNISTASASIKVSPIPVAPKIEILALDNAKIEQQEEQSVVKAGTTISFAYESPVDITSAAKAKYQLLYKAKSGQWEKVPDSFNQKIDKDSSWTFCYQNAAGDLSSAVTKNIKINIRPKINSVETFSTPLVGLTENANISLVDDVTCLATVDSVSTLSYKWKIRIAKSLVNGVFPGDYSEKVITTSSQKPNELIFSLTNEVAEGDYFILGLVVTDGFLETDECWSNIKTPFGFFIGQKAIRANRISSLASDNGLQSPILNESIAKKQFYDIMILSFNIEPLSIGMIKLQKISTQYEIVRGNTTIGPKLLAEYTNVEELAGEQKKQYSLQTKDSFETGDRIKFSLQLVDYQGVTERVDFLEEYTLAEPPKIVEQQVSVLNLSVESSDRGLHPYTNKLPIVFQILTGDSTIDQRFYWNLRLKLKNNSQVFPLLTKQDYTSVQPGTSQQFENCQIEKTDSTIKFQFTPEQINKLLFVEELKNQALSTEESAIWNDNYEIAFEFFRTDDFGQNSPYIYTQDLQLIYKEPPYFSTEATLDGTIQMLNGNSKQEQNNYLTLNPQEKMNFHLSELGHDYNQNIQSYIIEKAELDYDPKGADLSEFSYQTACEFMVANSTTMPTLTYSFDTNPGFSKFLVFRCRIKDYDNMLSQPLYDNQYYIKGRETNPTIVLKGMHKTILSQNDSVQDILQADWMIQDMGGNLFSRQSQYQYKDFNNFEPDLDSNKKMIVRFEFASNVAALKEKTIGKYGYQEFEFTDSYESIPLEPNKYPIYGIIKDTGVLSPETSILFCQLEVTIRTKPKATDEFCTLTGKTNIFSFAMNPPSRADRAHQVGFNTDELQVDDIAVFHNYVKSKKGEVVDKKLIRFVGLAPGAAQAEESGINVTTREVFNFIIDCGEWD